MDFIDERDVAFAEIRQSSDEVAGFFEGGAGGRADVDAQFSRWQLSESGFSEAWGAEKERVIEGLSSGQCCIDVDAQRLLDPVLADEFGKALGAKRELDYALVGDDFGGGNFGSGHTNE